MQFAADGAMASVGGGDDSGRGSPASDGTPEYFEASELMPAPGSTWAPPPAAPASARSFASDTLKLASEAIAHAESLLARAPEDGTLRSLVKAERAHPRARSRA